MRKIGYAIVVIIVALLITAQAKAEPATLFSENGFIQMKTTAYCYGEITYNGSKVHYGGCASSLDHLGDMAIIYTTDGKYIGTFECNDLGGTDAIRNGYVIDVYFPTYEECEQYMILTQGGCFVKYVKGVG